MNFQEIQDLLWKAIASSRTRDADSLSDTTHKLPLSDAFFCWEDSIKNKKFYEAIWKGLRDIRVMFPNEKIQVIDAGSGTWVLGILALIQWADYVSFIEANPHTLSWSKNFIEKLWYTDRCEFYCADATNIDLPQKYHLLISETITIDFQREDFHKIISHLKQFLYPEAQIIPEAFELQFSQKTQDHTIIQQETILRTSRKHLGQHIELIRDETYSLEISWTAFLYGDISISSWESMSFFNKKLFSRDDLGESFVWGK